MRKLVNGKVIDIKNIELFELAAEGLARQSTTVSNTGEGITANISSQVLQRFIKQYDMFFKAMPYPLYAVEADIKYATLANFIKAVNKMPVVTWVNRGLYIQLDVETKMTLHIVNNTWGIEYIKECPDNTSMELFKNTAGYEDYNWLLNKILNREPTTSYSYYETFMPDFLDACNYNDVIIKWELDNILNFGVIPKKIDLVDNKIIDISKNCEYTIDAFVTGTVESEDRVTTWDLSRTDKVRSITSGKQMKVYGFDTYVKSLSSEAFRYSNMPEKITKTTVPGLQSLFLILTGIKNAQEKKYFPVYKGFILDTNLVYSVNGGLYVTKSNRFCESIEIARGIEIYGVDRNNVYFTKSKRITESITRESIYSYNLADKSIKICAIKFKY